MPDEYHLTGVSMNRSISEKATISSNLRPISARAHAEDRAVEVDVLAPRQVRVKARADFEQGSRRGRRARRARRRRVMRERIFSSVLLPAPLWPMMPTISPCRTSRFTSFKRPDVAARSSGPPLRAAVEAARARQPSSQRAERQRSRVQAADAVTLADVLDGHHRLHDVRQITSANVSSRRRKM